MLKPQPRRGLRGNGGLGFEGRDPGSAYPVREGEQEENSPSHTIGWLPKRGAWAAGPPPPDTPPPSPGPFSSQLPTPEPPQSHPLLPSQTLFVKCLIRGPLLAGPSLRQFVQELIIRCHALHLPGTWGGDSVPHEGRGCASSSAVSPGPSPATQLDGGAGLGTAWPGAHPEFSAAGLSLPLLPQVPQLRGAAPSPHSCVCSAAMGPALHLRPTHSQGQWASLPGELGRHRLPQRGTRPSRLFLGWLSSAFHHPSLSGLPHTDSPGGQFPWAPVPARLPPGDTEPGGDIY